MVFLLSLDRRGGREWSGRRKSRLLTPSVRLGALFRGFTLAPGRLAQQHAAEQPGRLVGQIDSRSAFAAACRRSLTSASSSRRDVDAFLLCFRAGELAIGLSLLAVGPLAHRLSWRSIAATVRVSPANWPAMLAMSVSDDTPARVYAENQTRARC